MKALDHGPCIGFACVLVSLTLLAGACKAMTPGGCDPGYHDGGAGSCVPVGSCNLRYHDGGDGSCIVEWPYSCAPGYHDNGLTTCVADGTGCAQGIPWNDALSICSEWAVAGYPVVAGREMASYSSFTVALPNGGVLLGGGFSVSAPSQTWDPASEIIPEYEIWDPVTSTWSVAGTLLYPRYGAKAVTLADGRVLVAGGGDFEHGLIAEAEVYDPATMRSASAGTMNTTGYLFALTPLASGKALAIRGDPEDARGLLHRLARVRVGVVRGAQRPAVRVPAGVAEAEARRLPHPEARARGRGPAREVPRARRRPSRGR